MESSNEREGLPSQAPALLKTDSYSHLWEVGHVSIASFVPAIFMCAGETDTPAWQGSSNEYFKELCSDLQPATDREQSLAVGLACFTWPNRLRVLWPVASIFWYRPSLLPSREYLRVSYSGWAHSVLSSTSSRLCKIDETRLRLLYSTTRFLPISVSQSHLDDFRRAGVESWHITGWRLKTLWFAKPSCCYFRRSAYLMILGSIRFSCLLRFPVFRDWTYQLHQTNPRFRCRCWSCRYWSHKFDSSGRGASGNDMIECLVIPKFCPTSPLRY